jgi:D-alanyl-D-alanine carboxypeptidase (penicillin-binding protein 5/6)
MLSLVLVVLAAGMPIHNVHAEAGDPLGIAAKSAILVDADSGKILYEKNADEPLPPASMTKMMTEYLVLDAISQGKINWNDVVAASSNAAEMEGSQVWIAENEKRTVLELFIAMAVYSANDATVALAEKVAGSETSFVQMMNEKAKEFGMKNSHFLTSTGYPYDELKNPPQVSGDHLISAKDMAILARRLVIDHPEALKYTSIPFAVFRKGEKGAINMPNRNLMLPNSEYAPFGYEGVDGLKTGSTDKAGYNFTGTAIRNGFRLISVVMGEMPKDNSPKAIKEAEDRRFEETRQLFDYGFNQFERVEMIKGNEAVSGYETAPVKKGRQTKVKAVAKENFYTVVRRGEADKYKAKVDFIADLTAPVKAQQTVGYLSFVPKEGEPSKYLTSEDASSDRAQLVAQEEVKKAGWIRLFFRAVFHSIGNIFSGIFSSLLGK